MVVVIFHGNGRGRGGGDFLTYFVNKCEDKIILGHIFTHFWSRLLKTIIVYTKRSIIKR